MQKGAKVKAAPRAAMIGEDLFPSESEDLAILDTQLAWPRSFRNIKNLDRQLQGRSLYPLALHHLQSGSGNYSLLARGVDGNVVVSWPVSWPTNASRSTLSAKPITRRSNATNDRHNFGLSRIIRFIVGTRNNFNE